MYLVRGLGYTIYIYYLSIIYHKYINKYCTRVPGYLLVPGIYYILHYIYLILIYRVLYPYLVLYEYTIYTSNTRVL